MPLRAIRLPPTRIPFATTARSSSIDRVRRNFVDKPWIAVDVPRAGAVTCSLEVAQADAARPVVSQRFAGGNVYLAYTKFTLDPATGLPASSQLLFTRSRDCGATWSAPIALTAIDEREHPSTSLSQGATIQVDHTGRLRLRGLAQVQGPPPPGPRS